MRLIQIGDRMVNLDYLALADRDPDAERLSLLLNVPSAAVPQVEVSGTEASALWAYLLQNCSPDFGAFYVDFAALQELIGGVERLLAIHDRGKVTAEYARAVAELRGPLGRAKEAMIPKANPMGWETGIVAKPAENGLDSARDAALSGIEDRHLKDSSST